jgi:hypothetical protein
MMNAPGPLRSSAFSRACDGSGMLVPDALALAPGGGRTGDAPPRYAPPALWVPPVAALSPVPADPVGATPKGKRAGRRRRRSLPGANPAPAAAPAPVPLGAVGRGVDVAQRIAAVMARARAEAAAIAAEVGGCTLCAPGARCDHSVGRYTLPAELLTESREEFQARRKARRWDPEWTREANRQRRYRAGIIHARAARTRRAGRAAR